MAPRIAIPLPHSTNLEYSNRAIPQYERAVELAGGEAVRIDLNLTSAEISQLIQNCHGVLLPGSNADVDPEKFHKARSLRTAAPDIGRHEVDDLLLRDAYERRKPVLGICYGLQSLNVFRGGSLIQHIPDFLPEEKRTLVNHEAGKDVPLAHTVNVDADSQLATIVGVSRGLPVNSSHHQSADRIGEGLRLVARCAEDGIVEAVEGTGSGHFVLAVQWHPERSVDQDEASRAIFRALLEAAR